MDTETITLTFCDSGENHVGMKMLGERCAAGEGFELEDLLRAKANFEALGKEVELHDLGMEGVEESAHVLVIRGGVECFGDMEKMKEELVGFEWDAKYYDTRRKKVLNKHARTNVCFDFEGCDPNYENKQGRVIAWEDVPQIDRIRVGLKFMLGNKGDGLVCEGNRYYSQKCGIGFHGDSERRKAIGVRFGETMCMQWCWHINSLAVGEKFEFEFNDGDMYIMSEKAVGSDWKRRKIYTLRHAAGAEKYLKERRVKKVVVKKVKKEVVEEVVED